MTRADRKAHNMALYRDVNERVAALATSLAPPVQTQAFICECGRDSCGLFVMLPLAAYPQMPRDATTFLVIPGHEDRAREEVLVKTSQYLIVQARPSG